MARSRAERWERKQRKKADGRKSVSLSLLSASAQKNHRPSRRKQQPRLQVIREAEQSSCCLKDKAK